MSASRSTWCRASSRRSGSTRSFSRRTTRSRSSITPSRWTSISIRGRPIISAITIRSLTGDAKVTAVLSPAGRSKAAGHAPGSEARGRGGDGLRLQFLHNSFAEITAAPLGTMPSRSIAPPSRPRPTSAAPRLGDPPTRVGVGSSPIGHATRLPPQTEQTHGPSRQHRGSRGKQTQAIVTILPDWGPAASARKHPCWRVFGSETEKGGCLESGEDRRGRHCDEPRHASTRRRAGALLQRGDHDRQGGIGLSSGAAGGGHLRL